MLIKLISFFHNLKRNWLIKRNQKAKFKLMKHQEQNISTKMVKKTNNFSVIRNSVAKLFIRWWNCRRYKSPKFKANGSFQQDSYMGKDYVKHDWDNVYIVQYFS